MLELVSRAVQMLLHFYPQASKLGCLYQSDSLPSKAKLCFFFTHKRLQLIDFGDFRNLIQLWSIGQLLTILFDPMNDCCMMHSQ